MTTEERLRAALAELERCAVFWEVLATFGIKEAGKEARRVRRAIKRLRPAEEMER